MGLICQLRSKLFAMLCPQMSGRQHSRMNGSSVTVTVPSNSQPHQSFEARESRDGRWRVERDDWKYQLVNLTNDTLDSPLELSGGSEYESHPAKRFSIADVTFSADGNWLGAIVSDPTIGTGLNPTFRRLILWDLKRPYGARTDS